jgi:hypothetical protein
MFPFQVLAKGNCCVWLGPFFAEVH